MNTSKFNFDAAKIFDIDILKHERRYEAHHDNEECDTLAIANITINDDRGNSVSFFAEFNAFNHDYLASNREIPYVCSRDEYKEVLVNGIPEHNSLEIGTWNLHLNTNNLCVWQHACLMLLLRRSVDEYIDWEG